MPPFPARYCLEPGGGAPAEAGACTVDLSEGAVTISPAGGAALRIRFAELRAWRVQDYAVTLELAGGARAVLSAMGKRLDPFCAALPVARARQLGEALLLLERGAAAEESGEFRRGDSPAEPCRVRLQRTSLVVFPRESLPFRVGLGEVRETAFDPEAYAVRLALADGPALQLLRFGKRTDALRAGLRERQDALAARGLRALGALAPDLPALSLRALGALLPDGVPASRVALEAAAAGAWEAIRLRSFAAGERREAAAHLAGRAQEAWVAIKETEPPPGREEAKPAARATGRGEGKPEREAAPEDPAAPEGELEQPQDLAAPGRGPGGTDAPAPPAGESAPRRGSTVPPELAGREILYLFQIGRALALEVPSSTESATYVFRAGERAEETARGLVRALAAIQFRREPISLPDEQLLGGRGARYGEALALVPGLRDAREAFLGRAVHAGAEAWRKALDAALARS